MPGQVDTPSAPPRLAPERPLPPYGFVPGHSPHPVRDPQGHSHGAEPRWGPPPADSSSAARPAFLYALDLFNQGYYWEAHEGFESWWRACPDDDPRRPLFQGLLRLCAAGVKARQGHGPGVHSHAVKAEALLLDAAHRLGPRPLGLELGPLARAAADLALRAHTFPRRRAVPDAEPILGLLLLPSEPEPTRRLP